MLNKFTIIPLVFLFINIQKSFCTEFDECPVPLYGVISHNDLLQHFKKEKHIGGGGEASVYSVEHLHTKKSYALVIKHELVERARPNHRESIISCLIKNQAVNPHQAKICGYFWIANPNYPFNGRGPDEKVGVLPWKLIRNDDFLNTTYAHDPKATLYRHETILMEKGISSLDKQNYRDKNFDPALELLMCYLCEYSFDRARIISSDDKERNYIFVETKGQMYCGNPMDQYDFFCYQLEETSIYIPTPPIFIKRIDYSGFRMNDDVVDNSSKNLQNYIVETYPEGKYEWLSYVPPKDPNVKILHISL